MSNCATKFSGRKADNKKQNQKAERAEEYERK